MKTNLRVGDLVSVRTAPEQTTPGEVRGFSEDGMIGVCLMNEGGRVDLWHPSQVSVIAVGEAAKAAAKILRIGK